MRGILLITIIIGILFAGIYTRKVCESEIITTGKKITCSEEFFPLSVGNELYFKGYKKDKPDEIIKLKVKVQGIEKKDGEDFYYIYAPKLDMSYFVKRDENGLYMCMLKYSFLFFGKITVHMKPPLNIFKFPATVGLKWEENVKADASFLFISSVRDIKAEFEIVDKKTIKTDAGDIDAYLVHALVNQGRDDKEIILEKFWYGKGIGYSMADTSTHYTEIVGYRIKNEKTGEWNEKLPENLEEYL